MFSDNAKVHIYESEYLSILSSALLYEELETGGDLFGTFTHGEMPVIWFATGPGPNARYEYAEFSQDTKFTNYWQSFMMENFGLQYVGTWHSHHKLDLKHPSGGDAKAAQDYARRRGRHRTIEIIVSYEKGASEPIVIPYYYPDAQTGKWITAEFRFLKNNSPVRDGIKGDYPTVEVREATEKEDKQNIIKIIVDEVRRQISPSSPNVEDSRPEAHKSRIKLLDPIENLNITYSLERDLAFLSEWNYQIEVSSDKEGLFILLITPTDGNKTAIAFDNTDPKRIKVVQINLIHKDGSIDITDNLVKGQVLKSKEYRNGLLMDIFRFIEKGDKKL